MKKMATFIFAVMTLVSANVFAQKVQIDMSGAQNIHNADGSHFLDGKSVSVTIQYSKPTARGYGFAPSVLRPLEKSYASDNVKAELQELREYAYALMPRSVIRAEKKSDADYNLTIDVAAQEYIKDGETADYKVRFTLSRSHVRQVVLKGTYDLAKGQELVAGSVIKSMIEFMAATGNYDSEAAKKLAARS